MDVILTNNNYERGFKMKIDIFEKTMKYYYLGSNGNSNKDLVDSSGFLSDFNVIQKEVIKKRALFLNKLGEYKVSYAYFSLLKWIYGLEDEMLIIYDKIIEKYPFLEILSFEEIGEIIKKDLKLEYIYKNHFVIVIPYFSRKNFSKEKAIIVYNQSNTDLKIVINEKNEVLSPSEKILIGDLTNKKIGFCDEETYVI